MNRYAVGGCCVIAVSASLAWGGGDAVPMRFANVTSAVGVDARWTAPGNATVPPMFGGMAAGDFDRDGLDDLFILGGGGRADQLLIARMTDEGVRYTDRAADFGIDRLHVGTGVSVADYDNDGDLDLYITSFGTNGAQTGRHILYQNSGPDGSGNLSFVDVAQQAGVQRSSVSRTDGFSSSWGDIDLDGDLDLFVAGWIGDSDGNRLFRNNGDGTFTDITDDAVAFDMIGTRGFTPRIIDVTGDGFPEILIAADYGTSILLLNDGTGRFTDFTRASGTSHETNGMGATNADFDNDGRIDWYVTSIYNTATTQDGNKLYLNRGGGVFDEISAGAGVDDGGWGWGTAAGDIDLDGDTDIIETNGWLGGQWLVERAYVFLNTGDGTAFEERGVDCGVTYNAQGRGVLLWDMDRDGDLDAAFAGTSGGTEIYENDRAQRDSPAWVAFRLGTTGSPSIAPDGVGAVVSVTTALGTQHRWIQANSDYLSQSPIAAHFGLGEAAGIDTVTVRWPNGTVRTIDAPAMNTVHVIASCDADASGDGLVTTDDIAAYLDGFFKHERRADLRPDGRVNFFDLAHFVTAYQEGCEPDTALPPLARTPDAPAQQPQHRRLRP